MIKIYILCILCILFFGCNEPERQEYLEPKECLPDKKVLRDNAILQDNVSLLKEANKELQEQQTKDFQAMGDGLYGFFECHLAINCIYQKDYEYEGLACSDLTESEIQYYINSCRYSDSYFDFLEYVLERSYEYG